jgi:hypothetical protein
MSALRAGTILVIAAMSVTGGCFPGSGAPTEVGITSGGSGGGVASSRLAFLVQPNSVSVGSPINPEVKVIAVDSLGRVLDGFNGTVSVTLGSGGSGGGLSGTTSATASGGLAIFPSLVISQAGSGYTLIASASGLASVSSTQFTVF